MGIVGASGSGKSTIIQLIQRLHDTQGGEILIDGNTLLTVPAVPTPQISKTLQNAVRILIGETVVANVQAVAGITRTLTCPVVHL